MIGQSHSNVNGLGDLSVQGFPVYDAGHGNMNLYGGWQLGAPLGVFVPLRLREMIGGVI